MTFAACTYALQHRTESLQTCRTLRFTFVGPLDMWMELIGVSELQQCTYKECMHTVHMACASWNSVTLSWRSTSSVLKVVRRKTKTT
jgi:hypothetical protein